MHIACIKYPVVLRYSNELILTYKWLSQLGRRIRCLISHSVAVWHQFLKRYSWRNSNLTPRSSVGNYPHVTEWKQKNINTPSDAVYFEKNFYDINSSMSGICRKWNFKHWVSFEEGKMPDCPTNCHTPVFWKHHKQSYAHNRRLHLVKLTFPQANCRQTVATASARYISYQFYSSDGLYSKPPSIRKLISLPR